MGLGDGGLLDDGDGGGLGMATTAVSCSICLDVVMDNGDRSWAKLQCGHQFHLDCIGSAFNVKGAMQCPNCRKIEKGQWLYANGSRPLPEFSMDDWAHDDDLYDLNYSEMSFGLHWCPFSALTRLHSSFDDGEFQSSSYHDLLGHHAVFAEHNPVSSTTHPCPYVAYLGPAHPSSSMSSGNVPDGPSFNTHWSGPSVPSEVPNSYSFPSVDVRYHSWDHSSHFSATNRMGNADQHSMPPSMTQRTARNNSDVPRHGVHPFIIGHSSSGSRAMSSLALSALPAYPNPVARPRDRPPSSLQAYLQHPSSGPIARTSSGRRSSSHRGLAQVASMASQPDQSSGFFFYSPNSSGRTYQEPENPPPIHDHFHVWEHEQQHQQQLGRDSIWGPFHPPTGGSSNGFRPRH